MVLKDEDFWDVDFEIKDLLFSTDQSVSDIAKTLDIPLVEVKQRIKDLGLEWVRANRKLSKGHAALTEMFRRLIPGEEVINEYHVGERLMLDIYVPKYKLGAEYHGRQHFFYSSFFHKDKDDFIAGQARDERKLELCKEQGIAVVVFRFNDHLSEDVVYSRIIDAINNTPHIEKQSVKYNLHNNHFYEKMKQSQREYRKRKYREMKKKRNGK